MTLFGELIIELLLEALLWVILLPIFCIASTPVILIIALFQPRPARYGSRVAEWYRAVFDLWVSLWKY